MVYCCICCSIVISFLFTTCERCGGGGNPFEQFKELISEYPMVSVKGGSITGTDTTTKSEPDHNQTFLEGRKVKLDDFSIGKYEVTYELWYKVITEAEKRGMYLKIRGGQVPLPP
ncbi:SUMF1/EgtB/PvdO family nonheme iron enzyme [Treponema phagedenis]|nr:SUMF1/EgtB/PvdO family nonheme iron enzyme [Treponema phagedenis]